MDLVGGLIWIGLMLLVVGFLVFFGGVEKKSKKHSSK